MSTVDYNFPKPGTANPPKTVLHYEGRRPRLRRRLLQVTLSADLFNSMVCLRCRASFPPIVKQFKIYAALRRYSRLSKREDRQCCPDSHIFSKKNIAPCQSKFLVNFIGLVLTASMN